MERNAPVGKVPHAEANQLTVLIERQLELESGVADALEQLNREMAALLDEAGVYGPSEEDLKTLGPLLETLKQRQAESRCGRTTIGDRVADSPIDVPKEDSSHATLRSVIDRLPKRELNRLDTRRDQVFRRLQDAQHQLAANQVVVFYSTEFHRRYLLGVLQCDVDESNYKADGQSFKLPPEKIIGRNC